MACIPNRTDRALLTFILGALIGLAWRVRQHIRAHTDQAAAPRLIHPATEMAAGLIDLDALAKRFREDSGKGR